ncbi:MULTISPECIES: hypothetical protein [Sorangium]|uniref:Uncharacterized protein n=1 Tax=Sorangium cellulosum TaxID=56 RepID=A0A4P2QJP3_SORCE|nr:MULTISPECIES: hypothetical protein [Sorangium]AUX29861.1 hypothetical protein SOCE836_019540 [Sorangium cellulosum]WCQ89249.1 hypothetical protein NQZ70_01936 [Sorangium sp. Soce836]
MILLLTPFAQRSAPTRPARRFRRAACLAGAAAACLALGCQGILGIHDVSRDGAGGAIGGGDGGAAPGEGGGGSGGGPAQGSGGGVPQSGFSIALDPAAARVVRGGSEELAVTVTRSGDFAGDVELSLSDLPSGVTASPVVVPGGDTTGVLTLAAEPLAIVGSAAPSLRASAPGEEDQLLPVSLLVADPPGTLDQSFDGDGIASSGTSHEGRAVVVQDDGKIVVAGVDGNTWGLARFLPSGALDPEFGTGGLVVGQEGSVKSLALQPDGRIVAVGTRSGQLAVVRFNASGGLDQAFGASGVATIDRAWISGSEGFDVAVLRDGSIVAVGVGNPGNRGIAVRLSSTGDFDRGFAGSGLFSMDERPLHSVAIGGGDRIVAGGTERTDGPTFLAARLDPDGELDPGFGAGGVAYLAQTPYNDADLALGSDGKPVLVGYALDGVNDYAFARFTADGSADTTFGGSGMVNASGGGKPYVRGYGVALQADGKLLGAVAGGTVNSGITASILRLLPDGTADAGFGASGAVVLDDFPETNHLYAVTVQRDGRIVAVGKRSSLGLMVVRIWD